MRRAEQLTQTGKLNSTGGQLAGAIRNQIQLDCNGIKEQWI
jgi:hypothetical protein